MILRCYNLINTHDNFYFLGISENLHLVILQIELDFVNKYTSISIKTSKFIIFLCLQEDFKNFQKTLRMFKRFQEFSEDIKNSPENSFCVSMLSGYFLLAFFLLLFVSSYLVDVVPWSTTWIFASNVKALTLPGLSLSSVYSGAMNSISKSFIKSSILSSLLLWTASNNVNTWYHCQYQNAFCGYYSFFHSILINPSQL